MDLSDMIARIDARMAALGLSPKSLSRAAGLTETYVRDLREGRSTNPRLEHIRKLATALGLTLGELVGEEPAGLREGQARLAAPTPEVAAADDDRFAQVSAAVDRMLREEQAPHDAATVGRMSRVV